MPIFMYECQAIFTDSHRHLKCLRSAAHQAHILPALNVNLLSIGVLCDAGYTVSFQATEMLVYDGTTIVLQGHRHLNHGLWHVNLDQQPIIHASNATSTSAHSTIGNPSAADLVAFGHSALWSPVLSTLEQALVTKNYVHNFPGLTPRSL